VAKQQKSHPVIGMALLGGAHRGLRPVPTPLFGSGGGVSDGSAHHNLDGACPAIHLIEMSEERMTSATVSRNRRMHRYVEVQWRVPP
jgi:hypothetical protein